MRGGERTEAVEEAVPKGVDLEGTEAVTEGDVHSVAEEIDPGIGCPEGTIVSATEIEISIETVTETEDLKTIETTTIDSIDEMTIRK